MSVVASDILFVRGDGGFRPSLASPVASLDLVKQTGDSRTTDTTATSTVSSAAFSEYHHSPRWLVKNNHNNQKPTKYKQLFGSALRSDGTAGSGAAPLCSRVTSVTAVSGGPAGQTGSAGRRPPPPPAARSSLSSITSLILGTNRFRHRSAKAGHRSTTVINKTETAIGQSPTTIITGGTVTGDHHSKTTLDHRPATAADQRLTAVVDHRSITTGDQWSATKGDHRSATWIEKTPLRDNALPSQPPPPPRIVRQSEPAPPSGDVTGRRDDVGPDVTGSAAGAALPPRPGRPARVSRVAVNATGEPAAAAAATQRSSVSAPSECVAVGQERSADSLPVAPPRRRRPSGRLACSVGDLLDAGERRPRLVPLGAEHRAPSATTRLTIPLSGGRNPPEPVPGRDPGRPQSGVAAAPPADSHSVFEPRPDSRHDSTPPGAPRPRPRRQSKSTGSLLFAGETSGDSPPRAAPRSLRFSIGRPFTEHGARTSVQLTTDSAPQPEQELPSRQEPQQERPAADRGPSPPRQPSDSPPETHTPPPEERATSGSISPAGSEWPPPVQQVASPLSADSVADLTAVVTPERRTYRSRPSETGASPATPLFTKHGGSSTERRRTQSAFNARRTIAHRRQAEAAGSRSSSEPRRKHTATWVTGKINVSVTSVGRAASLTQLGAGGVARALTVSDRSSSSPTLEQEKRDIRRYLYTSNLISDSESPERERRLSESCLRLGAPAPGDELAGRPADPRLLSPDSVGSGWSAVTADVLTTRDAADDRSDVNADRCDVIGDRCDIRGDAGMAATVEHERERLSSRAPAPASNSAPRRLSTSVVHLWGPEESHIPPAGPSSLPSTAAPRSKPARPHSLSSTALLAESDEQPGWLRQSQERRSLRDGRAAGATETALYPAPGRPGTAERPAAELANGQSPAGCVSSESPPQPAVRLQAQPAPTDLASKSTVGLSSELLSGLGSRAVPDVSSECPSDIISDLSLPSLSQPVPEPLSDSPPPLPTEPPPESPTESPPPLPSEPPPESPTDSGPEPPWTSRFERPRRQSLSTSLPSFATVPVVADGAASVGRKPPTVTPLTLWSDGPTGLPGRPEARRPLRPTALVPAAGSGPASLLVVAPDHSGAADCTAERSGAGPSPVSLPSDRHTVQVRVERPERPAEAAAAAKQRRASTGVYLNGAPPTESRTKTSFTISLGGGGRKRPSLFSQSSSPSLLSGGQPASLPTQSSKSPTSPPPAKQPSSLPGLRHGASHRPLSSTASAAPSPSAAVARQPASLPGLFAGRRSAPAARRQPTSLPSAPPPPPPPESSPPSQSPLPLRSSLRSPPPSRQSAPRSPAAPRPAACRRDSSELQRQLEDDWARMERRHQAFLRHTAQQRGQPAPRSILKKQSAPSLLESVASEERPSWTPAEQPRRRASNVNWHDLERTKQQIRAEIERMKRQLRTDMGTGLAGPWPPRSVGTRPASGPASYSSSAAASSGRTVVETIHAIHIERDTSPGLVITEMPDDDGDDVASNHSGVVIEEILDDDEPDTGAPSQPSVVDGPLTRSPAQERTHGGPAASEPVASPAPSAVAAPWWRAPTVPDSSVENRTSHVPSWRRPSQRTSAAGTETRVSHSTATEEQTVTSGTDGSVSEVRQRHVQVDQLSVSSVSGQQQDLSLTHARHLYVDKRKTVHLETADGARSVWPHTASESPPTPPADSLGSEAPSSVARLESEAPSPAARLESEAPTPAARLEPEPPSPAARLEPEVPSGGPQESELSCPVSAADTPSLRLPAAEDDTGLPSTPPMFCQLPAAYHAPGLPEASRQSVSETDRTPVESGRSCQSDQLQQPSAERPTAQESERHLVNVQPVLEPQSIQMVSDRPHLSDTSPVGDPERCSLPQDFKGPFSPVKESQSSHERSEKSDVASQVKEEPQSPQPSTGKSRYTAPASTFGSWKARHAARLPPSAQQGRPSVSAVGRSVEAALGRLLADSGRADRGTQVTPAAAHPRSSAGRAVAGQRSPADRGGTPPKQRTPVLPRREPSAPRQGTPAARQGAPAAHQGAPAAPQRAAAARQGASAVRQGAPAVRVASRLADRRMGSPRIRTPGADGAAEAQRDCEPLHSRSAVEIGSSLNQLHHANGPRRTHTDSNANGDKPTDRHSASYRDSQTENNKFTRAKQSSKRVSNNCLIISHKLTASSPRFQTEMKWNEKGSARHRRGTTLNGGESAAPPEETRHYHTVDVDGGTITSRVVTSGGDLQTTVRTSSAGGGPDRSLCAGPTRRPAGDRLMTDHQLNSSRANKSAHGCRITVQEFIV